MALQASGRRASSVARWAGSRLPLRQRRKGKLILEHFDFFSQSTARRTPTEHPARSTEQMPSRGVISTRIRVTRSADSRRGPDTTQIRSKSSSDMLPLAPAPPSPLERRLPAPAPAHTSLVTPGWKLKRRQSLTGLSLLVICDLLSALRAKAMPHRNVLS